LETRATSAGKPLSVFEIGTGSVGVAVVPLRVFALIRICAPTRKSLRLIGEDTVIVAGGFVHSTGVCAIGYVCAIDDVYSVIVAPGKNGAIAFAFEGQVSAPFIVAYAKRLPMFLVSTGKAFWTVST